jgi:hypothetical protein
MNSRTVHKTLAVLLLASATLACSPKRLQAVDEAESAPQNAAQMSALEARVDDQLATMQASVAVAASTKDAEAQSGVTSLESKSPEEVLAIHLQALKRTIERLEKSDRSKLPTALQDRFDDMIKRLKEQYELLSTDEDAQQRFIEAVKRARDPEVKAKVCEQIKSHIDSGKIKDEKFLELIKRDYERRCVQSSN